MSPVTGSMRPIDVVDLLDVEGRTEGAADVADDGELDGAAVDFLAQRRAVEEDAHQAGDFAQQGFQGGLGGGVEQGDQGRRIGAVEAFVVRQRRDDQATLGQQPDTAADHLGRRAIQFIQARRPAQAQ